MRKATPHSIELNDKKNESVTPKQEVGASCEVAFLILRNRCYVFYHTQTACLKLTSGFVGRSSAFKSVNSNSISGGIELETTNLFNCLRVFWPVESSQTIK